MRFKEIKFRSADFEKECALRNEVLRVPLGLSLSDEDLSCESQQMHFGMFDPYGNLVACALAVACSTSEAKIRQMAVDSKYQRNGYGRNTIQFIEEYLGRRGFTHLFLHARTTAVGFYEKQGYVRVGQEFMEIGLPHVKMEKDVQPNIVGDG